jgi:uncharacterized lipoprotein YmbA
LVVITLLFAGCARTQPTSWYQLAATAGKQTDAGTVATVQLIIGLGPLSLPEILNRQQIVTRSGASRVELADRHRWAEPLQDNINRVMRENLAELLGTEQIIAYPWSRGTGVDYQIKIEIVRFEGKGLEQAQLEALWSILDREGKIVVPQRRSRHEVPAATADHEGLVTALSEALSLCCREMARELTRLPAPRS